MKKSSIFEQTTTKMLKYRLKNYLFFLILLLVSGSVDAQQKSRKPGKVKLTAESMKSGAFIDVNAASYAQSNFTIQQLVQQVLINGQSTCATPNVTNVTLSPNQGVSDPNRFWGYFNKATTNFPFTDGIVLVTGVASQAGNSAFAGDLSGNISQNGDADLAAATGTNMSSQRDAVALEFDFIPNSNQLKFNYLFASEEYTGTYPCSYSDAFALLIRPVSGGPYVNYAILPGTAGAVSVTNIHPANQFSGSPFPSTCPAINATYFGGYNTSSIETNFNGRVIPLTAVASVTPGVAYHFKMVLADYTDNSLDSAVFLEGGSFDIGINIVDGAGTVLPSTVNMCDNIPQVLTAQVVTSPGTTFQWFKDGAAISGATSVSYTATQPGVYEVQVTIPGNQCPGSAVITIVGGTSPVVQNAVLTACYTAGNATFDLTSAQSFISTTSGATFKYYVNQTDAVAGNNSNITAPTTFSSAGGQTIYVNVAKGFCSKVAQLQLVKAAQMTATIAAPQILTCGLPQITLNAAASVYPAGSTFNWVASGGGNIVSGATTASPVVNAAGTYTLTITKTYQPGGTCTATSSVVVTENKLKPIVTVVAPRYKICKGESVLLTASGAVTYTWSGLTGNGATQLITPNVTTTYTIMGTAANGCQSASPATVTIEVVPAIVSNVKGGHICVGDQITLDAGGGPNYTYLWNSGATTQTISVGAAGTYSVIIDNGVCSKVFTVQVIQAVIPQIISADYSETGTLILTVSNPSNGPLEYSADNGVTWQSSNIFTNIPRNKILTLRVRVKSTSCEGFLEYFTFVMQNVITPNGDNINDIIDFRGINQYKDFKASVFDRYGREVYKANSLTPYWDGYFQGKPLTTSSYWYQVSFEDPASKKPVIKTGWILLKNLQ